MGRKPIGRKAMTDTERSRRRYWRKRPKHQLAKLTKSFTEAEDSARIAFLDWLRNKKLLEMPTAAGAGSRQQGGRCLGG
jgi:hypothetical protein